MNLLAIDTSTDTLSIAVARGAQAWQHSGAGGAQASLHLLPGIQVLMAEAGLSFDALDAIVFGRGPGSFTGLRTACAVAQGLAFAARQGQGVPVLPVDTLLALAEQARAEHGLQRLVAALDARMDEVYSAPYEYRGGAWQALAEMTVARPEALAVPAGFAVAGNARAAYGERLAPGAPHVAALPSAPALLRLAPALLAQGLAVPAEQALPLYVRNKVAQTTAEREALKAGEVLKAAQA